MSVAAFNKFALLNEDDEGKGSIGLATAKSKAIAASPAKAEEPKKTQQQSKTGPAARSGRYYARGGGPKPQATDPNAAAAEESSLPTQRFDRTEGRHDRGRGRGGPGRGEGRGRGRGGRPYKDDRHSKTGIVDTSKQVSQGWGGTDGTQELAAESAAAKDAQEETKAEGGASWGEDAPAASWGGGEDAPAGDAAAPAEGEKAPAPEPEEDNTMTLDEYLAKRTDAGLSGLVGSTQPRKANEGAGDDLFAGAKQLLQEEDADDFYVGKPKTQRAPKTKEVKEKITIEIDGQFADSGSRGGRGRGRGRGEFRGRGRGGERGDRGDRGDRGGRGGFRGGRNAGPRALNVDDEKAFPSLG